VTTDAAGYSMRVELRGAFFNDPLRRKVIDDAIKSSVHEAALVGEALWKKNLFKPPDFPISRHGKDTGHLQRSIVGEVITNSRAEVTDSGVVYGPWIEGESSRNQTSRFKGYHSARKATTEVRKRAPRILNKHVRKGVARLNRGV